MGYAKSRFESVLEAGLRAAPLSAPSMYFCMTFSTAGGDRHLLSRGTHDEFSYGSILVFVCPVVPPHASHLDDRRALE